MLGTRSPKEHQALGRKVANYDAKIWNQCESSRASAFIIRSKSRCCMVDKEHIVEKGNYLKFTKSKDENMKRKLLETKDRELVEVSTISPIVGPNDMLTRLALPNRHLR